MLHTLTDNRLDMSICKRIINSLPVVKLYDEPQGVPPGAPQLWKACTIFTFPKSALKDPPRFIGWKLETFFEKSEITSGIAMTHAPCGWQSYLQSPK